MKKCKTCERMLPMTSFHAHTGFKDGRRSSCADCSCAASKKYYKENTKKHLALCRDWQKRHPEKMKSYTEKHSEKKEKAAREWVKNNPARSKAQKVLNLAVYKGELLRPQSCQVCGCSGCDIQGHHHDYSKPLDAIWVCAKCQVLIQMKRAPKKTSTATAR